MSLTQAESNARTLRTQPNNSFAIDDRHILPKRCFGREVLRRNRQAASGLPKSGGEFGSPHAVISPPPPPVESLQVVHEQWLGNQHPIA